MKNMRRFKDIINANINATLDKAENPEKMIRYMIGEMEDTLVDLKSSCAAKIAEKTRVELELEELTAVMDRWKSRAELAVEKGKDELAREALIEKQRAEKTLAAVKEDLVQIETIIRECKANTVKLEERLASVQEKQRILIQRGIHAQETILARERIRKAEGTDAFRRFEDLEHKIEQMEAEAEMSGFGAPSDKEDAFFTMEHENSVEAELAELKRRAEEQ
jgi:phage shock protein A